MRLFHRSVVKTRTPVAQKNMDGYELKKTLDKIIDYKYKADSNYRRYKAFFINVSDKTLKSRNGQCNYGKHYSMITINNLRSREPESVIKTAIHELSHHIDYVNRGHSNHKAEFYRIYRHLLYAAFDLGIVTPEAILSCDRHSTDHNKVIKIVEEYRANYSKGASRPSARARIAVHNAYSVREALKSYGFTYDSLTKDWYIEVKKSDVESVAEMLDSMNADYDIKESNEYDFLTKEAKEASKKPYEIVVMGGYEIKDELKEKGYRYEKKRKVWYKYLAKEDIDKEKEEIKEIANDFKILKRKNSPRYI